MGRRPPAVHAGQVGVWIFLATVSMLFAGFTSAYLVRRGGPDWVMISAPRVLWINSLILLSSSTLLECARFAWNRRRRDLLRRFLIGTTACGVAFLVGQIFAWQNLVARGVYLPTNPHSAFFFMLTTVHALHLVGGIGALGYLLFLAWRDSPTEDKIEGPFRACATYWHFLGALWLYIFVLLFVV